MEITMTSCGESFFYIFNDFGRIPTVEYSEDGSIINNIFSLSTNNRTLWNVPKSLWSNPITTTLHIIAKFYVKKHTKDANPSPITYTSYFSDFENTIENENIYNSLSIDLKNYNEQFEKISNFFCFNKTEWAKIFSVSRVTIYDWLNGKTTPRGDNANKIRSIYTLTSTLSDTGDRISQTYLHQNISKYNKSLMEMFLSSHDIVNEYQDLDKTIVAMINHSGNNKERLIKLAKSRRPKDEILDYNLKNLHY